MGGRNGEWRGREGRTSVRYSEAAKGLYTLTLGQRRRTLMNFVAVARAIIGSFVGEQTKKRELGVLEEGGDCFPRRDEVGFESM